jgi:hypothetical protein
VLRQRVSDFLTGARSKLWQRKCTKGSLAVTKVHTVGALAWYHVWLTCLWAMSVLVPKQHKPVVGRAADLHVLTVDVPGLQAGCWNVTVSPICTANTKWDS